MKFEVRDNVAWIAFNSAKAGRRNLAQAMAKELGPKGLHVGHVMGEMQQRAAESGQLKHVILGRNEPALHHFHRNDREALNQPPLEPVQ